MLLVRASTLCLSLLAIVGGFFVLGAMTDTPAEETGPPAASITWQGFSGNIYCNGIWHDDVEKAKYFLNDQFLGDGEEGFIALLAKLSELPVGSQVGVSPTEEWIFWPGQAYCTFREPKRY